MQTTSANVFNEFVHSLGLDQQAQKHSLALSYEDEAEIDIQYTDSDELLIILQREVADYQLAKCLTLALQQCQLDKHLALPVQSAYKHRHPHHYLVLAIWLSTGLVQLANLQEAIALLRRLDKRMLESLR